jgi:hypothetical protein
MRMKTPPLGMKVTLGMMVSQALVPAHVPEASLPMLQARRSGLASLRAALASLPGKSAVRHGQDQGRWRAESTAREAPRRLVLRRQTAAAPDAAKARVWQPRAKTGVASMELRMRDHLQARDREKSSLQAKDRRVAPPLARPRSPQDPRWQAGARPVYLRRRQSRVLKPAHWAPSARALGPEHWARSAQAHWVRARLAPVRSLTREPAPRPRRPGLVSDRGRAVRCQARAPQPDLEQGPVRTREPGPELEQELAQS